MTFSRALRASLTREAILQLRYRVVYAAAFVIALWIVFLKVVPGEILPMAVPAALWVDLAVFGFFFMGGILYLERDEGVFDAIAVSPGARKVFLAARSSALVVTSLVACYIVTAAVFPGPVGWPILTLGVILTALIFLPLGFVVATRYRTFSDYVLPAVAVLSIMQLPGLWYFGLLEGPAVYLIPTHAVLVLLQSAFVPIEPALVVYGVGYALLVIPPLWWQALRAYDTFLAGTAGHAAAAAAAPRASRESERGPTFLQPRSERTLNDREPAPPEGGSSDVEWPASAGQPKSPSISPSGGGLTGVLHLLRADVRNVVREPMLLFMVAYAPILIVVTRWLVGLVELRFGQLVDVEPLYPLILSVAGLVVVPNLYGAVVGLMLLDERDEGTLAALRVTPLHPWAYVAVRLAVPGLLSLVTSLAAVLWMGLTASSVWELAPPALLAAAQTPLMTLFMASVAGNKVEGLAIMKGIGVLYLAPIGAWFLSGWAEAALAVAPTYWPARAAWAVEAGESPWLIVAVGAVYHIVLLAVLLRAFDRRADRP